MAAAGDASVSVAGAALTVRATVAVELFAGLLLSVACTLMFAVPAVVGVPVMLQ